MCLTPRKTLFTVGILIVLSMIMALPIMAAGSQIGENILENPGFEHLENGSPIAWDSSVGWGLSAVTTVQEAARTDDYGIKMETDSTSNYWIRQTVPVQGGATYELSAWVKDIDVSSNEGTRMKIEFYRDTTDAAGYVGQGWIENPKVTGEWTLAKMEAVAPIEANLAQVYLRSYGPGTAYYDDASFSMIEPVPAVRVTTDNYFYYADIEQGTVYGRITPADGEFSNKTLDVSITSANGGNPILTESGLPAFEDFQHAFDPRPMQLQEPYHVELTLKSAQGDILYTDYETIYRWERPTSVREDGTLIVDGEPFFPVIGYHVPEEDYPEVKSFINTVQGWTTHDDDYMKSYLDEAHANDLKVFVPLYTGMKVKENFEHTERKVTKFKDHPALLGWMIMDEPSAHNIPYEEMVEAYRIIRTIDPVHPTYIVEASPTYLPDSAKVTDILVTDPYPLRYPDLSQPITTVRDHVSQAKEAVQYEKPVWNILQAFMYPDSAYPYLPTITELRNMAYQAILEGAQGLGYYSIWDPGWELMESELYPGILEFSETELPHISELILHGQQIDQHKDDQIQWGLWELEDHLYAVAINLTEELETATITLPDDGYVVEVVAPTEERYHIFDSSLNIELNGLESTLIKLTPPPASAQMISLVEQFVQDGTISDGSASHALKMHLTAIYHFKQQNAAHKVVQHLNGFEQLLDHLRNQVQISDEVYDALVEDASQLIERMIESFLKTNVELQHTKVAAGEVLRVQVLLENDGDAPIENAAIRLQWPEAFNLESSERPISKINPGQSQEIVFEVIIPHGVTVGDFTLNAQLQFDYKGVNMEVKQEKTIEVLPVIEAKLSNESLIVTEFGETSFTLSLKSNTSLQTTVTIDGELPEGMTLNMETPITVDAGQTVEVTGNVTIPNTILDGEYAGTIYIVLQGETIQALPFTITLNRNLVVNPGFETTGSWDYREGGERTQDEVYSGEYAATIHPDPDNTWNVMISSPIAVTSGKRYKMTGWVKNSATVGEVSIGIREIDADWQTVVYHWQPTVNDKDWTQYEVEFTAEENTSSVSIFMRLRQQVNGQAWFDDFRLEEVIE